MSDKNVASDSGNVIQLFTTSACELQEICSLNVAVSLWKHVLLREKEKVCTWLQTDEGGINDDDKSDDEPADNLYDLLFVDVKNALDTLKVPGSIAKRIEKSCEQVGNEMDEWKDYIVNEATYDYMRARFRSHSIFTCCVWNSNGTIDYKQSARKFISIASVSKAKKFEIASHFCLEDVINDLCKSADASLLALMKNFKKNLRFCSRPVLYYWLCRVTNRMHLLPNKERTSTPAEDFMLTRDVKYYWWSTEYFWERLSEQDQITAATRFIRENSPLLGEMRVKDLAAKMSESQLTAVLHAVPFGFLQKLIDDHEEELAFYVFTRIKDLIDDEQFVTLLKSPLPDSWLTEMWNAAYDHQKDAFLSQDKYLIAREFFNANNVKKHDQFPAAVLSYASVDWRKKLILEYGYLLTEIESEHYNYVSEIIRLCLPDASDADAKEFEDAVISWPSRSYLKWRNLTYVKRNLTDKFLKLYFPKNYETLKMNRDFLRRPISTERSFRPPARFSSDYIHIACG